ncbi:MAG TPA: hypothetical protein VIK78_18675 [Ruminiclostridium sp.]
MTINYAILSLLAIYGLICLFLNIFKIIGKKKYFVETANIVLLVNDQEQNIEGIVREAMDSKFVRNIAINGSFVIIDMNSEDDTLKILRKLEMQFPLIEVCSFDEKESIFFKG